MNDARPAKFLFPRSNQTVKGLSFFATGTVERNPSTILRLEIDEIDGARRIPHNARIRLKRGPSSSEKWIFHVVVLKAGRYALKLFRDQETVAIATAGNVQIEERTHAINVIYPEDHEVCCSDYFFAMGTMTEVLQKVELTPDGGTAIPSNTPITEGNDWFADWPVLNEGENATLLATGSLSTGQSQHLVLTMEAC